MTAQVVLPARVDSAAAVALTEELRAASGADLVVDASATTHLGALGLQTLLVAAGAWRTSGHRFTVATLTEEVAGQLAELGLTDLSALEGAAS